MSLLAPFAAALVGGTVGQVIRDVHLARILGPLAVMGGVVTELVVLHDTPGQPGWLAPLVGVVGLAAAGGLALGDTDRIRRTALAAGIGVLMIAPVTWSFQTLGHATSGTFPAGGPETASLGGGPGGGMRAGGVTPPGGSAQAGPPGMGGTGAAPAIPGPGTGFVPGTGTIPGGGGGGMFGGDATALTEAAAYAAANGGGTVVTASQSGAAGAIIASGSDVAGLGGFSGRESQVTVSWLANAVGSGKIRWVMTSSSGAGGFADGRTGATTALNAVESACVAADDRRRERPGGPLRLPDERRRAGRHRGVLLMARRPRAGPR